MDSMHQFHAKVECPPSCDVGALFNNALNNIAAKITSRMTKNLKFGLRTPIKHSKSRNIVNAGRYLLLK
jgi:hypothetical protein